MVTVTDVDRMPTQTLPNFVSSLLGPVRQSLTAAGLIACFALLAVASAVGQPPDGFPRDAADEGLQQVVVPLSEAVQRKIAEALSRNGQQDAVFGPTGDPILDDVLSVIRRRGSVLDGSSLDPQSGQPGVFQQESRQAAEPLQRVPPPQPSVLGPPAGDDPISGPDARFQVAEALLRAARKLSGLPGRDQQRTRVIAAMREQATVLMIDEFSQLPTDPQ